MKKTNFFKAAGIFAALALSLALGLAACSAEDEAASNSNEAGRVSFAIEGIGDYADERTVLPQYSESTLSNIKIYYGTTSSASTSLATYSTYAEFKNAPAVTLPVGSYYFRITADSISTSSGSVGTMSGTSAQTTLSSSSTATVSVKLNASGKGASRVYFDNASAIGAASFTATLGSNTRTENFSSQNYIDLTGLSAGSHLLSVTFKDASGRQVGVYTTYVQVLAGAISEERVDLSKLTANFLIYETGISVKAKKNYVASFTLDKTCKVNASCYTTDNESYFYLADKTTYESNTWEKTAPDGTKWSSGKTSSKNPPYIGEVELSAGTYYVIIYNDSTLKAQEYSLNVQIK